MQLLKTLFTSKILSKMKKTLITLAVAAFALTSCTTVTKTATELDVKTGAVAATKADLVVAPNRVSLELRPTKAERRGGKDNVKNHAVAKLLQQNGNADVLVAPEYEISTRRGLFGKKITSVTVSGYPAKYKNFK